MAKNDTILLDGIIDQRIADGLALRERSDVFEYLCFEQLLKDYDLSQEEIESGWIDGRDDGGIDGFFTFVNGHLLYDPAAFLWPKSSTEITVWILTCKHHDTYQQAPLNSLLASVAELFDLSVDRTELNGSYSAVVLKARSLLHTAYRRLAPTRPSVAIRFAYVSRGDRAFVEVNVQARADQIVETVRPLFSSCECQLQFVGAAELIAMYRRSRKFSIELPVAECLPHGNSAYLVLARLEDIAKFVTDDSGNLRRYLFDSNVRDFLGQTQINEDILGSLREPGSLDFWWLNNGVTILVTGATVVGKTVHLENIQIVNGLQTTETIFRHFHAGGADTNDRSLLVKIIVSTDISHRDRIIRATNSQNVVEIAGLRATDKIQRDIEEYLDRFGWYYERRKNYFKNVGKPAERFVTPLYLAGGYLSLVMWNPSAGARMRAKTIRQDESYKAIFAEETPLHAWLVITEILKRTEDFLKAIRQRKCGERFLSRWRHVIGFIGVSRLLGRFTYSVQDLVNLDLQGITLALITEVWELVESEMGPYRSSKMSTSFARVCCERAAVQFGIDGAQIVGTKQIPRGIKNPHGRDRRRDLVRQAKLSSELLDKVDAVLPAQPWPPKVHIVIATSIGCTPREVQDAIGVLIAKGRRKPQRDGIICAAADAGDMP